MDCSPPGSSLHGILQARILEWVAIPFSRESSRPGMEPGSPASQADSLLSEPPGRQEERFGQKRYRPQSQEMWEFPESYPGLQHLNNWPSSQSIGSACSDT